MCHIVILEAGSLGEDIDLSMFRTFGSVDIYNKTSTQEAASRVATADVIITNKVPMNEATLSAAKQLKMIALTATGVNNVDFAYTNSRGIAVANVKGYSTQSVIQHTFAMLFYLYEKLSYYDNYVKSGSYAEGDCFSHFGKTFHELAGKRWGIIGLGEIGQGVAAAARLFGCELVYYSTTGNHASEEYQRLSLEELLRTSDIVSIHAPLTNATLNLLSKKEFEQMKPEAVLLNLGRGAIIDQGALAKALEQGIIAAAGLDVLTEEPMSKDNPLLQIKDSTRLLITPHIAWATVEARTRCVDEVYKNIQAFLRGEERNVVKVVL